MEEWIIIADNDDENLERTDQILTKAGKRVTTLHSGRSLLGFVRNTGYPDMILMDTDISELDCFETMKLLKKEMIPGKEIPIILLTSDDHQALETRALESGAMDFIKKPYDPDVLVSRIQRILDIQKRIRKYERDAETDPLTGLLNKTAAEAKISALCQNQDGLLCAVDLDSFKSINDIFGHDIGDRVLIMFSDILREETGPSDLIGRIGGDEFILFLNERKTAKDLLSLTETINEKYVRDAKKLIGDHHPIPLGVSFGAAAVPEYGRDYDKLFHLADQALYFVKENGKHGCKLYSHIELNDRAPKQFMDLETITSILEERNDSPNAMWIGNEVFGSIYRYMVRYMGRYHSNAYRVLFTIKTSGNIGVVETTEIMMQFRKMMQHSLRNSDVMMECGDNQLFLLLPEIQEYDVDHVLSRIIKKWNESSYSDKAVVTYEAGQVHLKNHQELDYDDEEKSSVIVVDDNENILKMADDILRDHNINVTLAMSGQTLLELVKIQKPDLILLDTTFPDMNGVEVLQRLRASLNYEHDIPVIIMTEDNEYQIAEKCLELGAVDFLRKPFLPEILTLRVTHALKLVNLESNMADAVLRKAKEYEKLSLHVIHTLADIIDAKDTYTNGHSTRVAYYSKEIGRRIGYSIKQQNDIYMMGLLHDIGKIGIPDAVINKPGSLTSSEYVIIKTHPSIGGRILRNIEEMPSLYIGARWHHERYDGHGYPDGLSGKEIPEEARIITIADAYDAMTSRRSYRTALTQDEVKEEIRKNSGTQFDPKLAEIMLAMIDEDKEFSMREL